MTVKKQMDNETQEVRDSLYYKGKSQRWLDKKICKTENEVLGCFGQTGMQRKNLPTSISKQLFQVIFSIFCGQKKFFKKF